MSEPPKDQNTLPSDDAPPPAPEASSPTPPAAPPSHPVLHTKQYAQVKMPTHEELMQQDLMNDSCMLRFVMSGVVGGALGGVMGLVLGQHNIPVNDKGEPLTLTWRESFKHAAKEYRAASWSYTKTFAKFGAVYSASECAVEKVRAKHDMYNAGIAGCFTGSVLAGKGAGLQSYAFGCASVGAFSMAIEYYMEHY
mmetsp:Transcript_19358/g.23124  ORF Transcript_19358/g.23124 Transcript_19358/m.23124 type:complete len:195 (+) Transcript_19358:253-837(+)|eukprot:CAMPEP_0197854910 /NCGR_PEP_ID=MMETSP1438-20131217/25567_1 /TAXON_ID=1461541 /ORGANISM="Pterosperma sp., Strain CCMP1384" /LENGTH=194 /DNA_ID=CAMNT_0043469823 /DNA_START=227 /DNA_END=811 /DNA_ORIENTATION=+